MDSILNSSVMFIAKVLLNADAVDCNFLSKHTGNDLRKKRREAWENMMKKYENYEECSDESYEESFKVTDLGCPKKIQNDERETVTSYKIATCVPDNTHLQLEDVKSQNLFKEATDRTCSLFQIPYSDTYRMANSESDSSSKEDKYNCSARLKLDVLPEVITSISNKTGMPADLECERNVNEASKNTFNKIKNKEIKEQHISDEVAIDSKKNSKCTKNTNLFQSEIMNNNRAQMFNENHVTENNDSGDNIFDVPGKTKKTSKFIENERSEKSGHSTSYNESRNLQFKDKYKRNEVSGSSISVCEEKSKYSEKVCRKLKNSSVINNSQPFRSNAQIAGNEGMYDTSRKHKEEANLTDDTNELENVRPKKFKSYDTVFGRERESSNGKKHTNKFNDIPELEEKDNSDMYVILRTPVESGFQHKRKRKFKYFIQYSEIPKCQSHN